MTKASVVILTYPALPITGAPAFLSGSMANVLIDGLPVVLPCGLRAGSFAVPEGMQLRATDGTLTCTGHSPGGFPLFREVKGLMPPPDEQAHRQAANRRMHVGHIASVSPNLSLNPERPVHRINVMAEQLDLEGGVTVFALHDSPDETREVTLRELPPGHYLTTTQVLVIMANRPGVFLQQLGWTSPPLNDEKMEWWQAHIRPVPVIAGKAHGAAAA